MSAMVTESRLPDKYRNICELKTKDLKMLPTVALEALKLVKRPDCTIKEFTSIVERDAKLATDMLKLANSPIYSPGRSIAHLNQAVVRLGFRECKNLIMTSSIASLVKSIEFREEWIRELLWRHSFFTALMALHVNRTLDCEFQGEEFTAGLLHDFGRTLLAHILPDEFLSFDPLDFDETISPVIREERQLGLSHVDVGSWFAEKNQLPEELVEAIRYHHSPEDSVEHQRLVALISVADHMANYYQRNEESTGYSTLENPGICLLEATGVEQAESRFRELSESIMDEAVAKIESIITL